MTARRLPLALLTLLCMVGLLADRAWGESISMEGPVEGNYGGDLSGQLSLDVTYDSSTGKVCFLFKNLGTTSSEVHEIYFRDTLSSYLEFNTTDHTLSLTQGSTTDYALDTGANSTSPSNPPGMGSSWNVWHAGGSATQLATFCASADSSAGLDSSDDWVSICFDKKAGVDFSSLISFLQNDYGAAGSSVALHVGGLPGGTSDVYYNGTGHPVPEPATVALLGVGLAFLLVTKRRQG